MDEKELKTSTKTRVFIGIIAVIMIGSIIAGYAGIIFSNSHTDDGLQIDTTRLAEYQEAYEAEEANFAQTSQADFDRFNQYHGQIAAYDADAANANGLQATDLEVGTGKELAAGDTDYLAFYVGWCADGSVFNSTFNDNTNPTSFSFALDVSQNSDLLEGWTNGVVGMKLGGVRELTIPSEQAYKDQEICGGTNQPLKFMVMAVANQDPLKASLVKLTTAMQAYQIYANYGVDYDQLMSDDDTAASETTDAEAVETTEVESVNATDAN